MAHVFLSYSRADERRVGEIEDALRAHRISVFRDREIPINDLFDKRIRDEIKGSRAVLVCWSAAAAASDYVLFEADEARRLNKYVGCFLESAHPPSPYARMNAVDLKSWSGVPDDAIFLMLLEPVGAMIGGEKGRKLSSLRRAQELARQETEEVQKRRAAAEAARLEAQRRQQQLAEEEARRREAALREREAAKLRSFKEKALPFLNAYYWFNPIVADVAFYLSMPNAMPILFSRNLGLALGLMGFSLPALYICAGLLQWLIGADEYDLARRAIAASALWAILFGINVFLPGATGIPSFAYGPGAAFPATAGLIIISVIALASWRRPD